MMLTVEYKEKNGIKDSYSYLTLTGEYEMRKKSIRYVEAICICGGCKFYKLTSLKAGSTKSCGCRKHEMIKPYIITHGITCRNNNNRPIYMVWYNMKRRCYFKNNRNFKTYGARGVSVCEEWKENFINFYNWAIKSGWKRGLSLDRINNNGNYEPKNCRWATPIEQGSNTTRSVKIEAFSETKCLSEWERDYRCVVTKGTVLNRLSSGWSTEDAISIISNTNRKKVFV